MAIFTVNQLHTSQVYTCKFSLQERQLIFFHCSGMSKWQHTKVYLLSIYSTFFFLFSFPQIPITPITSTSGSLPNSQGGPSMVPLLPISRRDSHNTSWLPVRATAAPHKADKVQAGKGMVLE